MPDNTSKTNRIGKNTAFLYLRMMVVMIINLYTVRLVLKVLGVEDYGISNVVTGVITMLMSISSVLSTATQRYYSYSIGENKLERLQNIFSTSVNIFLILSIVVLILGETIGLWFVNNQLVIPESRMNAANWIYQFSIFSFIFTFLQVPYSAATIAHENIGIFAVINTVESVLRLISVLLISIIPFDGLIIYGATLFLISTLVLISYVTIGYTKYPECRYKRSFKEKIFKELLSFSGWSLFGSLAGVGMNQINTILVNVYFGPIVNAARAISFQFNMAVNSFSSSFLLAIRPPMIKSYAEESYLYLNKIFNLSNKFIYYSLLMLCLPLIFEMNTVLNIWLGTSDPQTILFSRLILVYALIMSLNNPISIIIQASGHVKEYHVPVEAITLLCVPATYILFKLGFAAHYSNIIMIIVAIAAHVVRLTCLKKYYKQFSYPEYVRSFIIPAIIITIIAIFSILPLHTTIENTYVRFAAVIFCSVLSISIFVLLIGLTKVEREVLKNMINSIKRKVPFY